MRVDVLVTGQATGHPETVTRTVLQNIAVLSAGQTIQTDGKSAISAPVVTLLVTPDEAEALTLANIEGRIQLVLRNSSDSALANPRGRGLNDLYGARAAPAVPAAPALERTPRAAPRPAPAPPERKAAESRPEPPAEVVVIRGSAKTVETAAGKGAAK
jgi:pilus assembly protein CpaB